MTILGRAAEWRIEMTVAGIKAEINLNTVVAIVGFLATFAGIITIWNQVQYKQGDFDKWIQAHDKVHEVLGDQINNIRSDMQKNEQTLLDLTFRIGQVEKGQQAQDERLSRVTDSYGNQFADIRSQLGAIATQLALTNQTLQAIAGGSKPEH